MVLFSTHKLNKMCSFSTFLYGNPTNCGWYILHLCSWLFFYVFNIIHCLPQKLHCAINRKNWREARQIPHNEKKKNTKACDPNARCRFFKIPVSCLITEDMETAEEEARKKNPLSLLGCTFSTRGFCFSSKHEEGCLPPRSSRRRNKRKRRLCAQ